RLVRARNDQHPRRRLLRLDHHRLLDGVLQGARAQEVGLSAMERKTRAATETGVYLFIVAAILVVANVISFGAYKRIDMTKAERFTLSKGSARLVHDLKQDLQMDLYV